MKYDLMVVIFKIPLHTWPWQQFSPVPIRIMDYRTVNMCLVVVISSQVFSYPLRTKIKIQQICVQQYNFMFTVMFHVVLFTGDVHTTNKQHVHCILQ